MKYGCLFSPGNISSNFVLGSLTYKNLWNVKNYCLQWALIWWRNNWAVRHNGEGGALRSSCMGRGDMVPEIMTAVHFHKLKINAMGILIIPQSDDGMIASE